MESILEYADMFNDLFGFHGHHDHHDQHGEHHHRAGPRRGGRGTGWGGRSPAPPSWFGEFFGPPPRADRGGVRYLVLDALAERSRHGYEVIQAIEERSKGTYRPSPGIVYPTLQMLDELGHVRVVETEGRKAYAITDEGQRDLAEHREEVADFYGRSAEHDWESQLEAFSDLKRQAVYLFKTFRRAAAHGRLSAGVQTRVAEVLRDAVKRIEVILDESQRDR
jgi:DNA-binding PadR family transcriptional regulator